MNAATGGIGSLAKVEKVYMDNSNILYCLSVGNEDIGNVRETFFLNQMRVRHRVTSSAVSDFKNADMTIEVGGKGRGQNSTTWNFINPISSTRVPNTV